MNCDRCCSLSSSSCGFVGDIWYKLGAESYSSLSFISYTSTELESNFTSFLMAPSLLHCSTMYFVSFFHISYISLTWTVNNLTFRATFSRSFMDPWLPSIFISRYLLRCFINSCLNPLKWRMEGTSEYILLSFTSDHTSVVNRSPFSAA